MYLSLQAHRPEIAPPKPLRPAAMEVSAAAEPCDGDAEDGEEEDPDGDPVGAVDDELAAGREGRPEGVVRHGQGQRRLEEERHEGVEAEDEAVARVIDASRHLKAEENMNW